jgi:hypothetical protein
MNLLLVFIPALPAAANATTRPATPKQATFFGGRGLTKESLDFGDVVY